MQLREQQDVVVVPTQKVLGVGQSVPLVVGTPLPVPAMMALVMPGSIHR